MKLARVFHNPLAGQGDITKKELVKLVESAGFECSYSSTKGDGWEKIESGNADLLVLAGGDGTVRTVAEALLDRKLLDKPLPIALLPLGTANNIAKTLGVGGDFQDIVTSWADEKIKLFDVGRIYGIDKTNFFLESLGFGIFPALINEMRLLEKRFDDAASKNMETALEFLLHLIESHESHYCKIQIDDIEYSGEFLLIEVMNTSSIGPNLLLAPDADPGDGQFEIVLITEDKRNTFFKYVERKLSGIDEPSQFKVLKAKKLQLQWDELVMHVDDQNITKQKTDQIQIELLPGLLQFIVPSKLKAAG